MRVLAVLTVAACASAPPVVVPPAPAPPQQQHVVCASPAPAAAPDPRHDALARELDEVDRELDAIDAALIANERTSGQSRLDAIAGVSWLVALAGRDVTEPALGDEPFLLARARARYIEARQTVLELERVLGPKNVDMVNARSRVERRAHEYALQRDVEVAYARELTAMLAKLPASTKPADVVAWRRRALLAVVPQIRDHARVPSNAPADILALAVELDELRIRRDDLASDLGPRHPEMVKLVAQIETAAAQLQHAIVDVMPTTNPAVPVTPEMVSRRAALATRARVIRQQLRR